jgi:hypothetical protein
MYVHIYLMIVTLSECKYFALILDNFHNICWDNFHNICWDNFHNICCDNFHNICWFYATVIMKIMQFRKSYTYILEKICNRITLNMYSHGHGISSVVVIQLALAVKHVLYFYPTLEFLTYVKNVTGGILIFIV